MLSLDGGDKSATRADFGLDYWGKQMSANDISYKISFEQALNAICPGLAEDLNLITTLDSTKQAVILEYLLGLACQAQNTQNITLGRHALWAIEKAWLITHIDVAAEPLLQLGSEWEYRRLIELYWHIDKGLANRLVSYGQRHPLEDIRLAAAECKEKLLRLATDQYRERQALEYWEL